MKKYNTKDIIVHKAKLIFTIAFLLISMLAVTQRKSQSLKFKKEKKEKLKQATLHNDTNTPLHLLQPAYPFAYQVASSIQIEEQMNSILSYLISATPTAIINEKTKQIIHNPKQINKNSQIQKGDFRITSYEWGVTYAAMIRMAQVTDNEDYLNYVRKRFAFLADVAPYFKTVLNNVGKVDPLITKVIQPKALDDAGAMCAAMIKTTLFDHQSPNLKPLIDQYIDYIMYHQYKLKDGNYARNRPLHNTVWLDDMFMSLPALFQMGKLTHNQKYTNEALKQIKLFTKKMFVSEKGLFRHGWAEGLQPEPSFFWARANGWALLTLCEALDVLPKSSTERNEILNLYQTHIQTLVKYQSGVGLWHQLINKNDSYLETSASAIYVYAIAHGINKGWLNARVYGPIATLGWNALSKKINKKGQVEGTCVGTGMGFDPAFYYHRPTSEYAAHGYGPMLLAGAEMIEMSKNWFPKINDSAIHFYKQTQPSKGPIFAVGNPTHPPFIKAGSSRKGNNPVVFIIGDSTIKNGRGTGDNGKWGWGSFFSQFFDTTKITIENHALGGRSSRSFITEGLWQNVLEGFKEGDYLIIQFGHNDGGPLSTGRARASLKGISEKSQKVTMQRTGGPETVYSYGHYMRQYIRQAKAQGVNVITLSHTPGNRWTGNKMNRCTDTYAKWTQQIATEQSVLYIDCNDRCAKQYESMGVEATKPYFKDNVHTSYMGAILHGKTIAQSIYQLTNCSLKSYINHNAIEHPTPVAPKPLYRDTIYDGAADPVVIWNKHEQKWFMFYTNRRANVLKTDGVDWVHGTPIGIAESSDGGLTWDYKTNANINYGEKNATYWAPDVIEYNGTYHMYLTVVPGIFNDWNHPRKIVHLTSYNLIDWKFESEIKLASDKVIDAGIVKAPNGKWRLYYNNERANKSIFYAESTDLFHWTDKGKVISDKRGEGPKVFYWENRYFMIVDTWNGLAVYQSKNMNNWHSQKNNILQKPGNGTDDNVKGGHADVVISNNRAYIFYFTHPGRYNGANEDNYKTRRSSIQVGELKFNDGKVTCNRNLPVAIKLEP